MTKFLIIFSTILTMTTYLFLRYSDKHNRKKMLDAEISISKVNLKNDYIV